MGRAPWHTLIERHCFSGVLCIVCYGVTCQMSISLGWEEASGLIPL